MKSLTISIFFATIIFWAYNFTGIAMNVSFCGYFCEIIRKFYDEFDIRVHYDKTVTCSEL